MYTRGLRRGALAPEDVIFNEPAPARAWRHYSRFIVKRNKQECNSEYDAVSCGLKLTVTGGGLPLKGAADEAEEEHARLLRQ